MAKIPKNLSDKDMMVNFKEELTFENMFSDEPEVKKVQKKDKENLNTAFLSEELQEKIGKALLDLKLELYKEGMVVYKIKVVRENHKITLLPMPIKIKEK